MASDRKRRKRHLKKRRRNWKTSCLAKRRSRRCGDRYGRSKRNRAPFVQILLALDRRHSPKPEVSIMRVSNIMSTHLVCKLMLHESVEPDEELGYLEIIQKTM
jgi:hypothetical protein